jgi:hypothetical protein
VFTNASESIAFKALITNATKAAWNIDTHRVGMTATVAMDAFILV